jgi:hypothetical protein
MLPVFQEFLAHLWLSGNGQYNPHKDKGCLGSEQRCMSKSLLKKGIICFAIGR